ncbi:hypothetical protein KNSL1_012955, partial [Colletotrichum chrysophilum]
MELMDTLPQQTPILHTHFLSKKVELGKAAALAALHTEEPKDRLQAYFDELRCRTPPWDMEVFIEGAQRLCSTFGLEQ